MDLPAKPRDIFDRDEEWASLAEFSGRPRHRFGIVYGRRRQGKSWLVERAARQVGGWYWEAITGTERQQLDAFAASLRAWAGMPAVPRFADWTEALQAVWRKAPALFVLDEFQYLVESAPYLPSILQALVSRAGGARTIVCGSALGPMRALLSTGAPLRGRASMELLIRPFAFREAARYWRVGRDLSTAARLHALVGGTPAYLDFAGGRTPGEFGSIDDWVCEVLLNPAGALFREGRILVEEPPLRERNLYLGILSAIAQGLSRRGQIASALGRPENTLAHPLNALVELALVDRVDDPLHERRSYFKLAEPFLRLYEALIAPNEGLIERRGAESVWRSLQATVSSRIYGPHFEHLAREWAARHASESTLGGMPRSIGPALVSDPRGRRELEVDLVASSGKRVLALGEAKWEGRPLGVSALRELEFRRELLARDGSKNAKLLLFGAGGFDRELSSLARKRRDVELIDLERLYNGD